ncbi:acetate--CoA ligase family protein [Candidatus Woesearchaeota archaeon]|nr:acetate--CoA ligase family protein [Candidatus Woesearchaeota archaeon]
MPKEVWTEVKAEAALKKYLPVARHVLCKNPEQVIRDVEKFSYPVVLKLAAKELIHKSDIGAVQIVKHPDELEKKLAMLVASAKKNRLKMEGILLQEYIEGHQLIIGIKKDPTFGHCIMLGLGGIFVEIMKDVAFRVCPITEADAQEMLNELKGKKILEGYRGEVKANIAALKEILVKVSRLPKKMPRIEELDINPLILNSKLGKVVDARMALS